ncbi:unnamed protein product [Nippostrongylus brasiliensis]|uniref:WGR domain-containing protein n=1 Tax=Nippostrongylus brasiliensis TaxID=27835 RepID=A0A0N4YKA1_NIPBR|nr:unnamed protein product [Nippostrongylus brasiliensis]
MINTFTNDDELTRWDKYWTMDSAGICEFTGTKNAEKAAINAQVEAFFNNTIEKRNDGYYVRLPYKDYHPPLPDNKQIATKRLKGVINMLRTNPKIMSDYNSTFQTQLEKGIIEEVSNSQTADGPITHYIPHHPVLTPHLNHAVNDQKLAQEIRDNLYVDNLILTATTPEALQYKITSSRQIFSEMEMNLREFVANKITLEKVIPQESCAKSKIQRVLGITWYAQEDSIHVECTWPLKENVTKRIVAQQIASIYDPLGWLIPLLTQAKHFQQTLWKHNYEWDSILPDELQTRWKAIQNNANDFKRIFPRRMLQHNNDYNLACVLGYFVLKALTNLIKHSLLLPLKTGTSGTDITRQYSATLISLIAFDDVPVPCRNGVSGFLA